jgi:hypothetical protein
MGGFMLFEGGKPTRTLTPEELESFSASGKIDFPQITEMEIQDKSKGDGLSKGIVVIQTGWFILQCIARGVENLPLTTLELITLAFASLNFATYGLWWNKPLNVRCPVCVPALATSEHEGSGEDVRSYRGGDEHREEQRRGVFGWYRHMVMRLLRFCDMFGHMTEGDDFEPGSQKVPTFYGGESPNDDIRWTYVVAGLVAVAFGAIHCIAWSFEFPSRTEQLLWRSSTIVIIGVPTFYVLLWRFSGLRLPQRLLNATNIIPACLYVLARVALLVLAIVSLRSPPAGTYEAINWTTFIPHT